MIGAYVALLLTCCAGVFSLSLWSVVAGALSLGLIPLVANRAASLQQVGGISEPVVVVSHVLNSSAMASAAYIFGYVARWAWGL